MKVTGYRAQVKGVAMAEAPAACPRCRGELVRNHHELVCLVHGQVWEEPRWIIDLVGDAEADEAANPSRLRNRGASSTGRSFYYGVEPRQYDAVTPQERMAWARNLREMGRSLVAIARTTGMTEEALGEVFAADIERREVAPRGRQTRETVVMVAVEELRRALGDSKRYLAVWARWREALSPNELVMAMKWARGTAPAVGGVPSGEYREPSRAVAS